MSIIQTLTPIIVDWGIRAFGLDEMRSTGKRAMRLLEEAVELAQAEGLPREKARDILDMVYDRPPGIIRQEIADVMNTLLAYSSARGIDPEAALQFRLRELLAEPLLKFQRRLKEKQERGL